MTNQKEGRFVVLAGIVVMAILIILFGNALSWSADKVFNMALVDPILTVKDRSLNTILKSDSSDFSIKAWGDECEMKIMAPQSKGKMKLYLLEGGNLEWEIVLASQPASNVFTYTIQTKGLKYYYQPMKLTQQEIDMDVVCPDSVKGSYAVYHATKKGNIKFGTDSIHEYRTGKAFHIYRPKAFDKTDTVWCDLNISGDQLSITVPQSFLDEAVYPITIDPQFGITAIGSLGLVLSGYVGTTITTMDAVSGQVLDSVVFYGQRVAAPDRIVYGAMYEDDAGPGPGALGESEATGVTIGGSLAWHEIAMAGTYSLTSSATYWPAVMGENYRIRYESQGSGEFKVASSFPDPFGTSSSGAYEFSIYCVYSVGAVELSGRRRRILGGSR